MRYRVAESSSTVLVGCIKHFTFVHGPIVSKRFAWRATFSVVHTYPCCKAFVYFLVSHCKHFVALSVITVLPGVLPTVCSLTDVFI